MKNIQSFFARRPARREGRGETKAKEKTDELVGAPASSSSASQDKRKSISIDKSHHVNVNVNVLLKDSDSAEATSPGREDSAAHVGDRERDVPLSQGTGIVWRHSPAKKRVRKPVPPTPIVLSSSSSSSLPFFFVLSILF